MGTKDIISKDLIKHLAFDLATILLKLDIDPDSLELLDTEKQRIEDRRADLVVRVRNKGSQQAYLLHIEIQNHNDKTMALRMLRYYTDIALQWPDESVVQYVIYIGKAPLAMPNGLQTANFDYRYHILDMREVDCQTLLQQDTPEALVLAILCDFKGKAEKDVVNYIVNRLKALSGADEKGFRSHLRMLEVLSDNRDLKQQIKEAEHMLTQVDYRRLPSYEIGLEDGLEQGLEKGLEKGLEQGREESSLNIAYNLLDKLADPEVAEIVGLPLGQVQQLRRQKQGS
jgi:predicted transposase/invertase (TIGR01784 family)